MKIMLESTGEIVTMRSGQKARVWIGKTARGAEVIALIARLAVRQEENQAEFEAELQADPPVPIAIDLRQLL